jgi:hypothetical protein
MNEEKKLFLLGRQHNWSSMPGLTAAGRAAIADFVQSGNIYTCSSCVPQAIYGIIC